MNEQKTRSTTACRMLLDAVKCDTIRNMNNSDLCTLLFDADSKKKYLVTWILDQIYGPEGRNSGISLKDVAAIFIPLKQFDDFMKGKLDINHQFKLWKQMLVSLRIKLENDNFEFSPNDELLLKSVRTEDYLINKLTQVSNKKVEYVSKYLHLMPQNKNNINISNIEDNIATIEKKLTALARTSKTPDVVTKSKSPKCEVDDMLRDFNEMMSKLDSAMREELKPTINASASLEYTDQVYINTEQVANLADDLATLSECADEFNTKTSS